MTWTIVRILYLHPPELHDIVEKAGAFDILVLANIIQRGLEHVTSNGARISYDTSKLSGFNFLRSTYLGINPSLISGHTFMCLLCANSSSSMGLPLDTIGI